MPALATALAVSAGVKAAYSYGKGRGWWGAQPPKQKISEEEKRRAAELERITREGRYSPATLAALRNKALQGAYGAAERGASNINQNLSRRGFEGSAIGAEAVKPLYAGAVNKAGEVSSDLAIKNEDSKLEAFNQLGGYGERKSQVAYGNAMAKYQHKTQNYDAAVGSLVDAGVGLYSAYNQPKPTGGGGVTQGYTGTVDPQTMNVNNANIQAFYDTSGIRIDQFLSMPANKQNAWLDSLTEDQKQQLIPLFESMGY